MVTRSAELTISGVGYTVYIAHSRKDADMIEIADDFALAAQQA